VYKIGLMPGDGVGPEIVDQAIRVLAEVAAIDGFSYEFTSFPQSGAHYRATGELLPQATIDAIGSLDVLFQGAIGDPKYGDGVLEQGIALALMYALDLSIGVRPGKLWAMGLTPLKHYEAGEIDILLVRDTTEDCFVAPGGFVRKGTEHEIAIGLLVYTHKAVERILRYSFGKAQSRRGHLALVTQANAIPAHTIWTRTLDEVRGDYPDVEVETLYCDSGALAFIARPETLDVVASPFWVGGILADLMGGVVGGVGLIGGARINPETNFGLFESAHGSAPKYAGQDRVSPIGEIMGLTLMLEHLGETTSSNRILDAIQHAFTSGSITDVSTKASKGTTAQTDEILRAINELAN
jgi:3-isopropylmalate dehydrogenase